MLRRDSNDSDHPKVTAQLPAKACGPKATLGERGPKLHTSCAQIDQKLLREPSFGKHSGRVGQIRPTLASFGTRASESWPTLAWYRLSLARHAKLKPLSPHLGAQEWHPLRAPGGVRRTGRPPSPLLLGNVWRAPRRLSALSAHASSLPPRGRCQAVASPVTRAWRGKALVCDCAHLAALRLSRAAGVTAQAARVAVAGTWARARGASWSGATSRSPPRPRSWRRRGCASS